MCSAGSTHSLPEFSPARVHNWSRGRFPPFRIGARIPRARCRCTDLCARFFGARGRARAPRRAPCMPIPVTRTHRITAPALTGSAPCNHLLRPAPRTSPTVRRQLESLAPRATTLPSDAPSARAPTHRSSGGGIASIARRATRELRRGNSNAVEPKRARSTCSALRGRASIDLGSPCSAKRTPRVGRFSDFWLALESGGRLTRMAVGSSRTDGAPPHPCRSSTRIPFRFPVAAPTHRVLRALRTGSPTPSSSRP